MENEKFKFWWVLLIKGLAALIFGIYTFISPSDSLLTLVTALGLFLLVMGGSLIAAAMFSPSENPNHGLWLFQGIFNVLLGFIVLWNKGFSEIALVYLIVAWFFVSGAIKIANGLVNRKALANWWVTLSGGIIVIFFGILIVMNIEGEGVRTLIGLVATGAVIIGIFRIVAAFQVKNMTFNEVAELRSSRAEFVDEVEGRAPESEE